MSREIPLSRGYVAIVDDADYAQVMAAGPWHACLNWRTVYAQRNVPRAGGQRTSQSMHTFLTGWARVDHRNGDGLDNQRSNLRTATGSQNGANMRRPKNNTSGFKGVSWHKVNRRWTARIGIASKIHHIGCYDTAEDAARAYDVAAREQYGEFAALNFPLPGERSL
jgi:hypothetical protein